VELSGFKTHIKKGIKLEIMQTARVDVGLEIGNIQDVVSVDAKVPQLESESSASGQVIKNEQVTNLPLNVRQFMQMVFLTPFSVPATRDIRSTLEPRDTTAPTAGGSGPSRTTIRSMVSTTARGLEQRLREPLGRLNWRVQGAERHGAGGVRPYLRDGDQCRD